MTVKIIKITFGEPPDKMETYKVYHWVALTITGVFTKKI